MVGVILLINKKHHKKSLNMQTEKYQIKDRTGANRSFEVRFVEKNNKGESLLLFLNKCENYDISNSLPKLWYKHGYINRVLQSYWHIEVYVHNGEIEYYNNRYNPQLKSDESGENYIINFDWLFEATEENMKKLIDEVYNRFINN